MCERTLGAALTAVILLTAGCATCEDDPEVRTIFETGEFYYKNLKFDEAVGRYDVALEKCPHHYQAWIGMGNACREYGNQLYSAANDLVVQGKQPEAKKRFEDANQKHQLAFKCFTAAKSLKPGDLQPYMGMGLLWHQRAASPLNYPHRLDDKENRRKDRDKAIVEFTRVIEGEPRAYYARRHRGILYLTSGQGDAAREDLKVYHNAVQALYDHTYQAMSSEKEEDRKRRDDSLQGLEKEIQEVREMLGARREGLHEERNALTVRGTPLSPEEEQLQASRTREILSLDALLGTFHLMKLTPEQQTLKDRCIMYLKLFNKGSLIECLSFLTARPGEEEKIRQAVLKKVEAGTKYGRIVYRKITVSGEAGSILLLCDITTPDGPARKGAEVVLRWQRRSGVWMLAEHP